MNSGATSFGRGWAFRDHRSPAPHPQAGSSLGPVSSPGTAPAPSPGMQPPQGPGFIAGHTTGEAGSPRNYTPVPRDVMLRETSAQTLEHRDVRGSKRLCTWDDSSREYVIADWPMEVRGWDPTDPDEIEAAEQLAAELTLGTALPGSPPKQTSPRRRVMKFPEPAINADTEDEEVTYGKGKGRVCFVTGFHAHGRASHRRKSGFGD